MLEGYQLWLSTFPPYTTFSFISKIAQINILAADGPPMTFGVVSAYVWK